MSTQVRPHPLASPLALLAALAAPTLATPALAAPPAQPHAPDTPFPDLSGTALAEFTFESPEKREGGAYFGAVNFLGGRAEAVLHPVQPGIDGGNEGWVMAIDARSARLSDLVPMLEDSVAGDLGLRRTALVLSTSDVRVDAATMTGDVQGFYGTYFEGARPMLEVARGVNLLTRIAPGDGSPLGMAFDVLGLDTDGVLLQGTVLKGASFSDLKKAHKEKRLADQIRKSMELRAYLPAVDLGGLPDSYVTGETSLIVNARPGVGLAFRLVADGGRPEDSQTFECRVDIAKADGITEDAPAPTEVQIMGTALGEWEDAFGLDGFDLIDPRLLLEVDTAQRIGFGVRAGFEIGEREMALAAKLQLHAITGVPTGGFFEGNLEGIGSADLVALANEIGAARGMKPIAANAVPEFELRDLYLKFAPAGGDSDLGTTDGFALRGELHALGTQLAHVDGSLKLSGIVPDIALVGECADIDLGVVALTDAAVDVRLGLTLDQHFRLSGATKLLGMRKSVDVDCGLKKIRIDIANELGGVYATTYHLSWPSKGRPSWRIATEFENQLSRTLSNEVSGKAKAWADQVERDAAKTREDLNRAQDEVRRLDTAINAAKAKVRARRDKQGAGLRKAQANVSKIEKDKAKVRSQILAKRKERKKKVDAKRRARDRAKKAWETAKRNRKKAPILKRPKLRAIEATKFADYQAKAAAYNTANVGYQALLKVPIQADARIVALDATMKTALAALKAAEGLTEKWPLETDPQVAALITARGTALGALEVAKGAVFLGGHALSSAGEVAAWAAKHNGDVFMIDSISFEAELAGYLDGNEVVLQVQSRLLGKPKNLRLRVSPDVFRKKKLGTVVWKAVKGSLTKG